MQQGGQLEWYIKCRRVFNSESLMTPRRNALRDETFEMLFSFSETFFWCRFSFNSLAIWDLTLMWSRMKPRECFRRFFRYCLKKLVQSFNIQTGIDMHCRFFKFYPQRSLMFKKIAKITLRAEGYALNVFGG